MLRESFFGCLLAAPLDADAVAPSIQAQREAAGLAIHLPVMRAQGKQQPLIAVQQYALAF